MTQRKTLVESTVGKGEDADNFTLVFAFSTQTSCLNQIHVEAPGRLLTT